MPSTDMKIFFFFFCLRHTFDLLTYRVHIWFFSSSSFSSVSCSSLVNCCVCRRRYTKIPQSQSHLDSISYSQRIKMIRFKYIVTQTQTGHRAMREWGTKKKRRCYELNDFESTRQIRDTSNQLFADADFAAVVVVVVVIVASAVSILCDAWILFKFEQLNESGKPNISIDALKCGRIGSKNIFSTYFAWCVCVLNDGWNRDSPSSIVK